MTKIATVKTEGKPEFAAVVKEKPQHFTIDKLNIPEYCFDSLARLRLQAINSQSMNFISERSVLERSQLVNLQFS